MVYSVDKNNPGATGTIWLEGLPGSGKTTLARRLLEYYFPWATLVDSDGLRQTLSSDLGYGSFSRREHARRLASIAQWYSESGGMTIVTCVTPDRVSRAMVRDICALHTFVEVYVSTPRAVCELRDPKGLYGAMPATLQIILDAWVPPARPDITVDCSESVSLYRAARAVKDKWHEYEIERLGPDVPTC